MKFSISTLKTIGNGTMQNRSIIFGLDILTHTHKGKKSSSLFSLVVKGEDHLDKYPKINKRTLLRKIFDIKPEYIAIDNIFELAPNAQGIMRLLKVFPPTTSLVQVTGNPRTGMEKLNVLVRKHRLKNVLSFQYTNQKMNSLETAEVCAYLCSKRVGHEIIAFEEEIKIIVSKKKSHGHGGWSAPRYERVSRTAVDQAGDAVEEILKEHNTDVEKLSYPNRQVFLVRLKKQQIPEIQKMIKELNTELVKVSLERVTKSNLEFRPLDATLAPSRKVLRNTILGIDPGTTTGIAVVDCLKGQVLYLGSIRECGISQVIRIASEYGKICCVAADVVPAPATVEKISRITGAKLLAPPMLMTASQKREYLQNYRDLTVNYGHLNSHERDSLYAALRAFNSLKDQMTKVQRIVRENYPDLISFLPEIQRLVVFGNSISNAITTIKERRLAREIDIEDSESEKVKISLTREINSLQLKIDTIYEEMDKLEREITYWRRQAREKASELKRWKNRYERERLKKAQKMQEKIQEAVEREVGRIKNENYEIRRQLRDNLKEMEKLKQIKNFWVQGREIPLKVIELFSEDAIRKTKIDYGLNEGDIVLVLNPSGGGAQTALKLIDQGVRGIIIPKGTPSFSDQALKEFENNCVPVLELPTREFSLRSGHEEKGLLEILVYEGLYLIDIAVKEEIRKQELTLREELRKKTRFESLKKKKEIDNSTDSDFNIDKILQEFKQDYITLYNKEFFEKLESSEEE
ncbi:MAG: DUF460 domain-containing protein [Candidatus Hodarchaeales archaeon]